MKDRVICIKNFLTLAEVGKLYKFHQFCWGTSKLIAVFTHENTLINYFSESMFGEYFMFRFDYRNKLIDDILK